VGNEKRPDGHGDPADQPKHKHGGREQGDAVASIRPATAPNISTKPKRSCVFRGTISISQAFRKMEMRIPALRKVKVLLMLETGRLKYSAIFPITIPVTITNAPVRA